jgi:hypothetical protein
MPYVQVYATELFSAGRASPPFRRISSLLHAMRAHRVRSRRPRGSPVSLFRVRLQRIHTGCCRVESCGASERPRPWGRSSRSARTPPVDALGVVQLRVGTKDCFAEKATSDRRCRIGCRLVGASPSRGQSRRRGSLPDSGRSRRQRCRRCDPSGSAAGERRAPARSARSHRRTPRRSRATGQSAGRLWSTGLPSRAEVAHDGRLSSNQRVVAASRRCSGFVVTPLTWSGRRDSNPRPPPWQATRPILRCPGWSRLGPSSQVSGGRQEVSGRRGTR